jgi:hypothetical protein
MWGPQWGPLVKQKQKWAISTTFIGYHQLNISKINATDF